MSEQPLDRNPAYDGPLGVFEDYDEYPIENDVDESMDGDFDTGMASAGFGTDEDYNGGCFHADDFDCGGEG